TFLLLFMRVRHPSVVPRTAWWTSLIAHSRGEPGSTAPRHRPGTEPFPDSLSLKYPKAARTTGWPHRGRLVPGLGPYPVRPRALGKTPRASPPEAEDRLTGRGIVRYCQKCQLPAGKSDRG